MLRRRSVKQRRERKFESTEPFIASQQSAYAMSLLFSCFIFSNLSSFSASAEVVQSSRHCPQHCKRWSRTGRCYVCEELRVAIARSDQNPPRVERYDLSSRSLASMTQSCAPRSPSRNVRTLPCSQQARSAAVCEEVRVTLQEGLGARACQTQGICCAGWLKWK